MRYYFFDLDKMGYEKWKDILSFCLRISDRLNVTHMMKEERTQGDKLYWISEANTEIESAKVWHRIYEYALDNSDDFVVQYEINDKSMWVEERLREIQGDCLGESIIIDGQAVRLKRFKAQGDYKKFLRQVVEAGIFGYDDFDWSIQMIDSKMGRDLFSKMNSRNIVDGRGCMFSELNEEEIEQFNMDGYAVGGIVEYKHRFVVNKTMNEKYIKLIETEAYNVNQGDDSNFMGINLYKEDREILTTNLDYSFRICLNDDEIKACDDSGMNIKEVFSFSQREGYSAPEDYLTNNFRVQLHFKKVEWDLDVLEKAVDKFFKKIEI